MRNMDVLVIVKKQTYVGLFMITLATLMYEILLTRIFSVTMWYHFAFVAISVAMFGMTVGALLVYLFPNFFTQERAKYHITLSSLLFTISIVLSFLTHLSIPFIDETSVVGLYSLALTYVVISIPFIFSGTCICLAITKFPRQVSKLYAADLAGAAFGCILVIQILNITDGPTAVIVVAVLASIGTVFFAADGGRIKLMRITLITGLLLVFFIVANTFLVSKQLPLLRLIWVKGGFESTPLYEKWNSFSRIRVVGNPNEPEAPFGWGLSSVYPSDQKVRQLHMDIDATAGTVLTAFDGNLKDLEFLKYDVTNIAHYIRRDSKVLAVGPGGGRDILSAFVFEQKSVLAVEINRAIIDAVNQRFGDFTGHLDRNHKVTFVNDEARSYITRLNDTFDIIQVSLIDSWAATTAGAFTLTENSLYTIEAWKVFLDHLNPDGVLTFSRWYFRDSPGEVYRLTSLASASLTQLGIDNPRNHIVVVRHMDREDGSDAPDGIGTILVSKKPFSDTDLDTIKQITNEMQFDLVLSPRFALDSTYATIASGKDLDTFTARFPINISAPTDDSPFFFHMLRLRDIFDRELWDQGVMSFNMKAVYVLGALLITVGGLTILCIIVPLILTTKKVKLRGAMPFLIFFATIGLGFMLVEISQMQRLIIYLGHPTYGLSVVLFALLLSSGIGSYSTQKISNLGMKGSASARLVFLLCAIILFGKLTPYAIHVSQGAMTIHRVLVAIGILFPMGLFMGMAFPLGMKIASKKSASITPWLWGINGATSVCASVLAVVIALSLGISTVFWAGFSCYVVALTAFVWAGRGNGR
jgi:hypothetical protein